MAIARTIVHNASLLLDDEPTGALDEETGKSILNLFKEIIKGDATVIAVTHEVNVTSFCQRAIRPYDGETVDENVNVG